MIALVVAHSANRVIGRDGGLPWRLPTDMRHFRELTSGHTVLMGRNTFESLPDAFRPLPDRRNLVLSCDPGYQADGAEIFTELAARARGLRRGLLRDRRRGHLPRDTAALADRIYATEIDVEIEGDTFFPELAAGRMALRASSGQPIVENELTFTFRTYERAKTAL